MTGLRMNLSSLIIVSGIIRVLLIIYGEIQDMFLDVKYTDIDYAVFTDAARYVTQGASPFLRSTYRYSPLLAYIVTPNIFLHSCFGKVLFSCADLWCGYLLARLSGLLGASNKLAVWAAAGWLCNPFTATISTRGSCDALVVAALLQVLWWLGTNRDFPAALLYGLVVHFRVYPIIYAPSIVLFLTLRSLKRTSKDSSSPPSLKQQLITFIKCGLSFGFVSGGLFIFLTALFHALYPQHFLHESLLYHLTRRDPRHNFSPYFYPIYLAMMGPTTTTQHASAQPGVTLAYGWNALPMVDVGAYAGLPILVLAVAVTARFSADLAYCWVILTLVFVAFNKVCTAQYFIWYFGLLPLLLPALASSPARSPKKLILVGSVWLAAQLHWLVWGYMLEFEGRPVHLALWAASLVFLLANTWLICTLMSQYQPQCTFLEMCEERHEQSRREKME